MQEKNQQQMNLKETLGGILIAPFIICGMIKAILQEDEEENVLPKKRISRKSFYMSAVRQKQYQ